MRENDIKRGLKSRRIIIATRNKGKLEEMRQLLARFPCDVISMADAGITDDIAESGSTFEENAMIKARSVWKATGETVIADDSGLEVDFLGGAPGVYSARFAGMGATDGENNKKLLDALAGVPEEKRTARYVCVIAVVFPSGRSMTVRGVCEGYIAMKPEGNNGFGYDPLFYFPGYGMTAAQMDPHLKNSISHRGIAMRKLLEKLKQAWDDEIAGN
ncbi:MAG: XTP/dITP diphosphatase [Acetivibrionales bacterium]